MKQSSRVVFLESHQGVESLFTRGLRSGATACGWETEVVFLADASGQPRSEKDVRIDLLQLQPDTVCFLMDAPLGLKNIWDAPSLASVDKISLWFDDYYRSPNTLANPEVWTSWQKDHGVRVGFWDGHWRRQWRRLTGADAFPVHLGADPRLFRSGAEPLKPGWADRAVFVGTVPSQKSLDVMAEAFPRPLQRLLEDVTAEMGSAAWPLRPYELSQSCRSFLGVKYGMAIDATLKDPKNLALWNHLIWRLGKRTARLRGLAAVAKAGPIGVLSGHGTECYAGEEELRSELPAGTDFAYADTRTVPATSWKSLFKTGKWQMQITDPQSVEGGLPFRVFECGAAGVPLLSDHRPDLVEFFPAGSGVTTATDEASLTEAAASLFQLPATELEKQGRLFHEAFLARHTWAVRWREIAMQGLPRPATSPFLSMPKKTANAVVESTSSLLDQVRAVAHNKLRPSLSQSLRI